MVGSHSCCWAIVDVDSVTSTESTGHTALSAAYTSGGVNGEFGVSGRVCLRANGAGTARSGASVTASRSFSNASRLVAKDAFADRCGSGETRVRRDLQQFGAFGQVVARHIRVVAEHLSADHHDEVVSAHDFARSRDRHR